MSGTLVWMLASQSDLLARITFAKLLRPLLAFTPVTAKLKWKNAVRPVEAS